MCEVCKCVLGLKFEKLAGEFAALLNAEDKRQEDNTHFGLPLCIHSYRELGREMEFNRPPSFS